MIKLDKNIIHIYNDRSKDIFDVIISLTYKCNYSCNYCGWHQDGDIPNYTEIIMMLETIILSTSNRNINFLLHGGEPTIIPDLYDSIEYIIKKYDNVTFNIQTNTSKSLNWFKKFKDMSNNVTFTCSYQHHQNKSFDEYFNKIIWLNDNGLLHAVDFILEPMNELEIIDIIKYINKLSISDKVVYTYVDMVYNDKYDSILDIIDNKNKDTESIYVKYKNGEIRHYYNTLDLKMLKDDNFRFFYCYAGMRQIYVEPNGDVYRCITDRYTKKPRCNVYDKETFFEYVNNGPYPCIFKECICEIWVEKVRVGYENKV